MINEKKVKRYCIDDISKIENYDKAIADMTQTWHLHHRLELTLDGDFALSRDQLMMHDMYYNRPYYELIFLTPSGHHRLHGHNRNDEYRRKISEAQKRRLAKAKGKSPMKGKHHTDETRKKMSDVHKNMSDETRRKMSEAHKGKVFTEEHRRKMSEAHKGKVFTEEHRRKMSEAARRRWTSNK